MGAGEYDGIVLVETEVEVLGRIGVGLATVADVVFVAAVVVGVEGRTVDAPTEAKLLYIDVDTELLLADGADYGMVAGLAGDADTDY